MKFGVCIGADTERLRAFPATGFDYAESSCGALCGLSEEEFEAFAALREESDVSIPAANGFFPGGIKLMGEESDKDAIRAYLQKLLPRAKRLGIGRFVFGSGKARAVPAGMNREAATEELIWDLKEIICPLCDAQGIEVVIEPLRTQECNILNTVHESLAFMQRAGISNLKVLADVYHMKEMDEDFAFLADLKGKLVHSHTSKPLGGEERRCYPAPNDGFDQAEFLRPLVKAGVETCSVEAGTEDFVAEAKQAVAALREAVCRI